MRDADEAVKDESHADLKALLERIPQHHFVMLGIDANVQFGPAESIPIPAEETNANEMRLLELAVHYNLYLANTVKRTIRDQRTTWSSGDTISRDTKSNRRTGRVQS